ncbi:MAG TPA: MlaD family protein [Puia sp.]|jgi:phospholipid/cholesterol/gamma-HCH transport system substrate-binding protein|nr:MlaD family protein [Puia sp.]
MKIANETKVGLMAVIALAGLILGFNFLKGSSLFQHAKKLYALFDNVDGMEVSNAVQIDGLTIGNISAISETDKDLSHGILVTITLKKDVHIPVNSVATLNPGLLISPTVVITKGDATEYLDSGDTLLTKKKPNIIAQIQQNIDPIVAKLNGTLTSLDSLVEVIGTMFDPRTKHNFSAIIANLANSSAELEKLLNGQTGYLAQSLKNLNEFTGNLSKNNDHITHTLDNMDRTTAGLASARIPETVQNLNSTLSDLRATIGRINSTNGTLGLLMNDKRLYQNLESTTRSLNTLLDDFRVHPKRYVNISVFGKKDKTGPLTSPAADSSASKPVNQ